MNKNKIYIVKCLTALSVPNMKACVKCARFKPKCRSYRAKYLLLSRCHVI